MRSSALPRKLSARRLTSRSRVPFRSPIQHGRTSLAERILSYSAALTEALREEMHRDSSVFLMGEDLCTWGDNGGVFGVTKGLAKEFGLERVRDTPISERLRRARSRCRGHRHASGRRADVRRLSHAGDGASRQPGREDPLHVRWTGWRSARRAHQHRRIGWQGRTAFSVAGGVADARPRPEGRRSSYACGCQRAPDGCDSRQQPGDLPRAQALVLHQRTGSGRRARRTVRQSGDGPSRWPRNDRRDARDGRPGARGGLRPPGRKESTRR